MEGIFLWLKKDKDSGRIQKNWRTLDNLIKNPELFGRLGPKNTARMFEISGYKTSGVIALNSGHGVKIEIKGHSINYIQFSNGDGRHGVKYIKIGGNTLKIVEGSAKTYKGKIQEELKSGTVFRWVNNRGNRP